ncbi:TetR/AcrR family transcriptional regulator [Streptomyces sp. NPDC004610]|uniref:TetR/AcrR family transcriptional regulator n=1 Tax=unclassified Streptomyces TaxID=2593676 RepID=UPI0033BAB5D6
MRAGPEVFDTEGWSALSARRVCETAGLTRRYFYESFASPDALIAAIFVSITGGISTAIKASVDDEPESRARDFGARMHQAGAAALAVLDPSRRPGAGSSSLPSARAPPSPRTGKRP